MFWAMVLEKSLESSLDCKEIKPVNPKGIQSWIFIGRTDAEAEASILWPPDAKGQHTGKHLDAGKGWGQEEKGMTEYEMVWWHHWLNGHEFEQAPGDGEGQGSLTCFSSWGHKELDRTTKWEKNYKLLARICEKVTLVNDNIFRKCFHKHYHFSVFTTKKNYHSF